MRLTDLRVALLIVALGVLLSCASPVDNEARGVRDFSWTVDTVRMPSSQAILTGVYLMDKENFLVTGHFGGKPIILRFSATGWVEEAIPPATDGYHFVSTSAIDGSGYSNIVVVGDQRGGLTDSTYSQSYAIRFNGTSWIRLPSPGGTILQSVSVSGGQTCFVGGRDILAQWNGVSWVYPQLPPSPVYRQFVSIVSTSDETALTIGVRDPGSETTGSNEYELFKVVGTTAVKIDSVANSVTGGGAPFGKIIGSVAGSIYSTSPHVSRFEDGGWQRAYTNEEINFLGGTSASNILAVGAYGAMAHFNGSDWRVLEVAKDQNVVLRSVAVQEGVAVVVGYSLVDAVGLVYRGS